MTNGKQQTAANSGEKRPRYDLIPRDPIRRLADIYEEGIRYGENNWKRGLADKSFLKARLNHGIEHLFKYLDGDRSEDHLAKLAWMCFTFMEADRVKSGDMLSEPLEDKVRGANRPNHPPVSKQQR